MYKQVISPLTGIVVLCTAQGEPPEASGACNDETESQLDKQLSALREQIVMVDHCLISSQTASQGCRPEL